MLLIVSFTAVGSLQLQSANMRRLTLVQGPALDANGQLLQAMTDAQAGLNGYQLSGDRALLQPYFGTHDRTMSALATIQAKFIPQAGASTDIALRKGLVDAQRLVVQQWWANALSTEQTLSRGEQADLLRSRALFDRFRAANAALGRQLSTERDQTQLAALTIASRGEAISIAATLLALLAMLVLGRQIARTISRPLTELRDAMVRQRQGEPGARAREDQGSSEIRSVAGDFNALTEQNLALQKIQGRALSMNELTFGIARAIRAASDTQQALNVLCAALGEGLGVDRAMASTFDVEDKMLLGAQWHLPDLPPLGDLSDDLLPRLARLAEEVWLSEGFLARPDFLAPQEQLLERSRMFHRETGARAVIMAPIGLGDRVIGMIFVIMVHEPREWTESEGRAVHQVAGFAARAIVHSDDRAHQSQYVERLEGLDRQKSDFLATVSHELRTPLTSISGYLELLQDGDVGELTEQQHGMLEVINRNTGRLRSLIEDVMVLSRIEGGVTKANFVEVSIGALITRVGEELCLLAQKNAIELEIDAGPEAALVLGDKASLDRAVVNILSNAIKFSRPGGVVTIRGTMDQSAGRVSIICQDRGVGIPSHDQGHLFTRFFRASNAMRQAIPGTGLGLSIVKQIVEDHFGQLRLISVEGEGTTVVMDLSLYEPSQPPGAVGQAWTVGNDSHSEDVFVLPA
jgi:two-component system, OmpR family, phosphate regulon sensor histidine kinase PhoR